MSRWITYSSWIADGIYQAWYNYNADVLSNSWGAYDSLCVISTEIENAYSLGRNQAGCLVVAASGNYQTIVHSPSYSVTFPGNLTDYVISVGAISPCGERKSAASCDGEDWWGSCYGPELSVVAPGVFLPSTDIQFENGYNNSNSTSDYTDNDYTNHFNGSSGACPHVSGIAALLLSVNPYLTALETRNIIEQTAQKIGNYNYSTYIAHPNGEWNNEMGYGLVDAHKAVTTAKLYHTDFSISGPVNMNICEEYTYTLIGNVPNNFDITWETSPYLCIIERQGTHTVKVRALYPSVQNSVTAKVSFMGAIGKIVIKENIVTVGQGYVPITNIDTIFRQNHTFVSESSLGNTITIDSGVVFTISNILHCTDNARLIVLPGGKLVVDGGTLTSACPGEL